MYIAIVEDHPGLRQAIGALLESAGYASRGFASAEEFLAGGSGAGCLILDEHLPGIDGHELQHRLGADGRRLPIIFISARQDVDAGLPDRAMRSGALAYFRKPFSDVEFLGAVDQALCREIPRYT
jgi:FixJ family two-component response regulator